MRERMEDGGREVVGKKNVWMDVLQVVAAN